MRIPLTKVVLVAGWTAASCAAGCAATYRPPTTPPVQFSREVEASKSVILAATVRALALEGYSIQSADEAAGVLSTVPRQQRLTADDCDCGTTLGLPYIKDNRTITTVAFAVVAGDHVVTLKPDIQGEYLKGVSIDQSITFNCVSRGTLEGRLFESIVRQLAAR